MTALSAGDLDGIGRNLIRAKSCGAGVESWGREYIRDGSVLLAEVKRLQAELRDARSLIGRLQAKCEHAAPARYPSGKMKCTVCWADLIDTMAVHTVHCKCDGRGIVPSPDGAVKCDGEDPLAKILDESPERIEDFCDP